MCGHRIFSVLYTIGLSFIAMIMVVCFMATVASAAESDAIDGNDSVGLTPARVNRAVVPPSNGEFVGCGATDYPIIEEPGTTSQRVTSIQDFCDVYADNMDSVVMWGTDFIGDVVLDQGLLLIFDGGWNCDHTIKGDPTRIWGQLRVSLGILVVDNISIHGYPDDDAYEDNDILGAAFYPQDGNGQEYDWDSIWLFNINGSGMAKDDDWYRIYVSGGSNWLSILLKFTHLDGDINMALYNSSGTYLTSASSTTDNESILYSPAMGGYYYILVYPYGSAHGNTYDLWWFDYKVN